MLHLIFQSPLDKAVLERIAAGDDVVFLDSAVLGLLKNSRWAQTLELLATSSHLYVLADDLTVRGITEAELVTITLVDYAAIVALTVNNTAIQTWS